jgi:hypothetical protein
VSRPSRTPSWDEIEKFCQIDGWETIRSTDYTFFRKVLSTGEVLETHTSFSGGKSMSQNVFRVILRTQLKVSRPQFWAALESGSPVGRPDPDLPVAEPRHDAWVIYGLKKEGLTEGEIEKMTPDEARERLHELWSKSSDR